MKQFLFLTLVTLAGGIGAITFPYWGVLLYYFLAILRPQYLWGWALPIDIRWSALASAAVFLGVAMNGGRLMTRARFNTVTLLMLFFAFWLMLSTLTAYFPAHAMIWAIEYAKIFVMVLLATFILEEWWQVRLLFLMVLVTAGYIAWEVNYLYIFQGRLDIFHNGLGGMDNNGAGLMLAMGIPLAYAFGVSAKRFWRRGAAALLGVFMLHAVLMSYSRGAMVAGALVVVWLLINHRPRYQAAVIALIFCVAVSVLAGKEIRDRFISTERFSEDPSAQSRLESWAAGWQMATDHPLTGQGIRNSAFFSQNYGTERRGRTIHSQYIQIAADSGIPAMLVYTAMFLAALWCCRKSRRAALSALDDQMWAREDPDRRAQASQIAALALGCEGSLLIFGIGGVFLSLEMFELPWLLIAIASVMPRLVALQLEGPAVIPVPLPEPDHRPPTLRRPAFRLPSAAKGLARP